MTILSTLRDLHYLTREVVNALRRLATPPDDDSPDAYAEHLARLHAEAQPDGPPGDCGLGEADECLCDPDGGLSCDSCCEPPSVADEPTFTEWLASVDARLAAIQDQLNSAAPGPFIPDAAAESPVAPTPESGAAGPPNPEHHTTTKGNQP